MTADLERSIYFGQPIIDAYRLEESQCWYGVALCPGAGLPDGGPARRLKRDEIPVSGTYPVPLKGGAEVENLSVINWPVFADSLEAIREALQPFDGRNSDEGGKLAEYHRHTLLFAETMWRKYRR